MEIVEVMVVRREVTVVLVNVVQLVIREDGNGGGDEVTVVATVETVMEMVETVEAGTVMEAVETMERQTEVLEMDWWEAAGSA